MNLVLKAGAIVQSVRGALWFWPTVAVIAAVGAGLVLVGPLAVLGGSSHFFVFRGDIAAGLQVLSALLGAVITAVSVVFSATLIVLQTVSSQFSPRLLRSYMRDPAIQAALSVFLGTVAYILAILHGADSSDVPRLAISVALVLVLVCVAMIGYVVHHLSRSIRVETIMERITYETLAAVDDLPYRSEQRVRALSRLPDVPPSAMEITATASGYLQNIDLSALGEFAAQSGLTIRMRHGVGGRIIEAAPLAWAWSRESGQPQPESNVVAKQINGALRLGSERTLELDIAFGFRQLIDMAIKALSPGINDPYTAVQAINNLARLLCRLAPGPSGDVGWVAEGAALCVAMPGERFDTYLALACDQIRRYGAKEPAVALSLLNAVRDVSAVAPRRYDVPLHREVKRLLAAASRDLPAADDVERVRVDACLTRRWIAGDRAPEPVDVASL